MNSISQRRRTFSLNKSRKPKKPNYLLLFLFVILCLVVISFIFSATYVFQHTDTKESQKPNIESFILPKKDNPNFQVQKKSLSVEVQTAHTPKVPDSTKISEDPNLPQWITDYIAWHRKMRSEFPGQSIITDPNAPPVLIRTCLGLCGGLHDRLGQLPLDLFLASQTKRVLLIKWIKPQPLEEFLVPPPDGIDWIFPSGIEGWGTNCNTLNLCAKQVRLHPELPGNNGDARERKEVSFGDLIDKNLKLLNGKMKNDKAVTYQILGHLSEDYLEKRLRDLGETDMIHGTASFGNIFRKFFQPHPNVQKEIDEVSEKYGLIPGEYTVAHCRVRHPKAYKIGETFNGHFIANADKLGLPFEGRFKDLAVDIASRAVQCAVTLPDVEQHPIYFMADESELVRFVTRDVVNATLISEHANWFSNPTSTNATAKAIMSKHNVVARDQDIKNAHIDKNKGRPVEEYYGTFVDMYLGIQARCVVFGVGYYALFASKLSGTRCKLRYAKEMWGGYNSTHEFETQSCALPL